MKLTLRPVILLLLASACASFSATPAAAVTSNLSYTFSQSGYAEGATVTGAFTGADLDGNGILVHFPPPGGLPIQHLELTSWSMHFSGNSRSPAFDLSLNDLYGFVYQIGTSGIGDDPAFDPTINQNLTEGIGAIGAMHFYTSGLGPNGVIGGHVGGPVTIGGPDSFRNQALDSSTNLVQVTRVPEPAAFSGFVIGLSCVLASARRKT